MPEKVVLRKDKNGVPQATIYATKEETARHHRRIRQERKERKEWECLRKTKAYKQMQDRLMMDWLFYDGAYDDWLKREARKRRRNATLSNRA